jgi:hypothetical protein
VIIGADARPNRREQPARRDRGLPAAIETFMQTRSAFQPNRAALSTASLVKNAAQLSSSGNDFWNSASDRALAVVTE